MTDPITPGQFHEAKGVEDWRLTSEGATAFFRTRSFAESARFVQAISLFQSFWPRVAENPTSEEFTDSQRELSQTGKDILITGSRTLWNDLLAQDLVDEIHLLIGNRILGQGVAVFVGQTPTSLRLIDTRRWEDSDNVLLRYEVLHKSVESPA